MWLSYGEANSESFALKGINLEIRRAEKIAFCGRTGSGKTSIFNALFRLYELRKGNIYVNGSESSSISLRSLRQQLCIIPQVIYLYFKKKLGDCIIGIDEVSYNHFFNIIMKFGFLYNASLKDNIDPENLHNEEFV